MAKNTKNTPHNPIELVHALGVLFVLLIVGIWSVLEAQTPAQRRKQAETPEKPAKPAVSAPAGRADRSDRASGASKRPSIETITLDVAFTLPAGQTGIIITPANTPPTTLSGVPGQPMKVPVLVNRREDGMYSVNLTTVPDGIQEIITVSTLDVR
jgi:hypothetical protein